MIKLSFIQKAIAVALTTLTLVSCDGDVRPLSEAVEANEFDLESIQIQAPANSLTPLFLSPGESLQFSILGRGFTGNSVNVSSNNRRWTSTNSDVASVSEDGLVVGRRNGTTSIGVRVAGAISQQFNLTVSDAALERIERIEGNGAASNATLQACIPAAFTAIGSFGGSDLRALRNVVWSIDDASRIAGAQVFDSAINQAGGISLVGRQQSSAGAVAGTVGEIVLTASILADEETGQGGLSASRSFQVSNTISELSVTPNPVTLEVGGTERLVATALINGQNVFLTAGAEWIVSVGPGAVSVGTVGASPGVITGLTSGTATVMASCGNVSGDTLVTVENNSGTLSFNRSGIVVLDLDDETFAGLRLSTGNDFNIARDVTNEAEWSSSDITVATVDNTGNNRGELTLLSEGETFISAEFEGTIIRIEINVETSDQ